jgi:putative component of membrane protein insertase Oxa1/YidC/SpoIIIJ protein YidD
MEQGLAGIKAYQKTLSNLQRVQKSCKLMNEASRDTIQNVEKKLSVTGGFLNELEGDLGKVFGAKGLNYQRVKT